MEHPSNAPEKAAEAPSDSLRRAVAERLAVATESGDMEAACEALWEALSAFAGDLFKTAKGLSYTYSIRGNEMFFTRKEKSVTRASVNMAFDTVLRLQGEGTPITGPKMLRCFGASYLYPIFIRIGVVHAGALIMEAEKE